jgi:threonine dehydrogenase-like Zn-dependent dehydrogenase
VRRELALSLGATEVIDPTTEDPWARLRELHGSVSTMLGQTIATDALIEATGSARVIQEMVNNARPDSRISVVAVHHEDLPISFLQVMMKQLTIRGAMEYPARFASALELLARRDLSAMITHRFAIEDFGDAIALLQESKECGKVMITMGTE